MRKIRILGVDIDLISMQEAVDWVDATIQKKVPCQIITANPEMVMVAQKDQRFYQIMNQADLVIPDGIGLILGAKYFLNTEIPERVTGFDLSVELFQLAQKKGYRIYLFGAAEGVAAEASKKLIKQFPGLQIVGSHHGYVTDKKRSEVIAEIKELMVDILLVGLGAPRQDIFIADYKDQYQVPVSIGIGGSIDIWAEQKSRAPVFLQNLHLEWFYRLLNEPSRFFRMLVLPKFVYYIAKYKEDRLE